MNNIAVLITCYNRKEKTLKCLDRLFEITNSVDVYVVDDGCTDGTSEAIVKKYSSVKVIKSKGNLFWNRGMHLAWEVASKKDYEYYIWLNDDVYLYENFLDELFECFYSANKNAIISGVVESYDYSEILYGGYDKSKVKINPNGTSRDIFFMNGNVVLVSRIIFLLLGNFNPKFHHDLGDVDYGFRAKKSQIKVLSTKIPIACGEKNLICRERLNNANLLRRFKRLYSPLGSNPKINFYFRNQHLGFFNAVGYFIFQHLLNLIPDKMNVYIFGNKYN